MVSSHPPFPTNQILDTTTQKLRDDFAIAALPGIIIAVSQYGIHPVNQTTSGKSYFKSYFEDVAWGAYQQADAMMEARDANYLERNPKKKAK